jgi:hypothetical protein
MSACGRSLGSRTRPEPARTFLIERNDLIFFVELKRNGIQRYAAAVWRRKSDTPI